MNIQDIQLIYDYNFWANKHILDSSAKVSQEQFDAPAAFPYGGLRGTLLHILETEFGWRTLCETLSFVEDLNRDDFPTVASLEARWREEENATRTYLNRLSDGDMISHLRYTSSSGEPRDRILWHCLLHLVNHGTQHRSEAAALLTEYGQSPGDLDFVVFLNEHKI